VALNLSEKLRLVVISVSCRQCWIHLSTLSEFAGPLQSRKFRRWRANSIALWALTGVGAAGAGLMYAVLVASANPTQGSALMLDAIAAVFLEMTMSKQGEPRVVYTLIGVIILGILDNGLTQMQVDSYIREILVGLIVISAVAVASFSNQKP
jgi:ribose/xylose/arabinose/galactoside ABC-type transport system permease subunit